METIGFIGLGIMGGPMADNLREADYEVVVYNRSEDKADDFVEGGGEKASSPREAAEKSDVVITMLPDSPQVEEIVLGEDGVAEGVSEGMLYIDMSSIAPATSRKVHEVLEEKGADAVDAPVSGGQPAAESGELAIMVGGSDDAVERARPILEVMGKAVTHIGPPGAGQVAKAANQVVVALTIQAISEALTLARKSGVDAAKVREALLGGLAQSKILEMHGERMLEHEFDPGFKLSLHRKDLAIALQAAREEGVPLLATAQAAEVMNALIASGHGDDDHAVIASFYEELAGVSEGESAKS
ncbi:2-hydroxy-3-oxopropionate reductase [soil metagenome]|jgi:2-hydroxy-3-oxopropionate reductase|nr:2-hydroxy-3-oxopropionate reductase [Thermoleophilaceae bacterium]MDQ3355666.1 2-hydroxy-3-oxopropionate reductase [Actinomycetota bacterium]